MTLTDPITHLHDDEHDKIAPDKRAHVCYHDD